MQGKENMTNLARAASSRGASEPTARRTLQALRKLRIISCGRVGDKGRKVRLTRMGKKILGL
jgi:Fic family protein